MSFTIYVANKGGKANPISQAAWWDAVKKCSALTINHSVRKNGKEIYEVFLPGKHKRYISLTPHGVIATQRPSEEIIHIMFALANTLQANVYNENFKQYANFEDWERKTRHERHQAAIKALQQCKQRRIRLLLAGFVFTCFCILGWFLSDN